LNTSSFFIVKFSQQHQSIFQQDLTDAWSFITTISIASLKTSNNFQQRVMPSRIHQLIVKLTPNTDSEGVLAQENILNATGAILTSEGARVPTSTLIVIYSKKSLPFHEDSGFDKWGYLAPLSWVKVLWQSLDTFNIQLHMKYHILPFPQERDQVIAEIILDGALSTAEIKSLSRCRGMLQCIFLSDLATADGRYLESFVFNPGPFKWRSIYIVSHERVRQKEIGTHGVTSGTIMQPRVGNSKSHLAVGHTQHTGNGYGSPPQSKTFTELRTELFTIIYQHSPNVIPAQGWYIHSHGKRSSE